MSTTLVIRECEREGCHRTFDITLSKRGAIRRFCSSACGDAHRNATRSAIHGGGPETGRKLGALYTSQRQVLGLLSAEPIEPGEIAKALGYDWVTVRHDLDGLVRRQLAAEVPGRPTRWVAVNA